MTVVVALELENDLSELSSDDKIKLLASKIKGWFPTTDLDKLAEFGAVAAGFARKVESAITDTEKATAKLDLKYKQRECDNEYTHTAAHLRKKLIDPRYAEELSILKAVTTGQSCQISALRDVLHILTTDHKNSRTD
jgi:hypothetical protein